MPLTRSSSSEDESGAMIAMTPISETPLARRGPWRRFGLFTGIIGIGILLYVLVLILIIAPGVCKSTSIHEKTQQTVSIIGMWDAQFISERFCQCYESSDLWKRLLPLLSITFFAFVVLLLVWLNMAYGRHREDDNWDKWFRVSNEVCVLLGVISFSLYAMLVLFTHRTTCVQLDPCFEHTWDNDHVHYMSTGLFFSTFFLLWLVVLTDNYISDYTDFRGKMRGFHLFVFFLFLTEVCCFFYFAGNYVNNYANAYKGAIYLEYIIFLTLVIQCSFALCCVLIYHKDENCLKMESEQIEGRGGDITGTLDFKKIDKRNEREDSEAPLVRGGILIKYVTLNTDIL
jgi:hypothetical protein